jgi:hypothetical protein
MADATPSPGEANEMEARTAVKHLEEMEPMQVKRLETTDNNAGNQHRQVKGRGDEQMAKRGQK